MPRLALIVGLLALSCSTPPLRMMLLIVAGAGGVAQRDAAVGVQREAGAGRERAIEEGAGRKLAIDNDVAGRGGAGNGAEIGVRGDQERAAEDRRARVGVAGAGELQDAGAGLGHARAAERTVG